MNALEVTNTDRLLFVPKAGQNFVALQNNTDTDIFLSFDGSSPVTLTSGWRLAPGESITLTGESVKCGIRGIHSGSSGTKYLTIQAS